MAGSRDPVPKATGPQWLRNAGVRLDEFAREAVLAPLPSPPPAPAGSAGAERDATRRRLLAEAGDGLNYTTVRGKSTPTQLARHTLAARHAIPSSFVPQRHVAYVLGRPCVVFR